MEHFCLSLCAPPHHSALVLEVLCWRSAKTILQICRLSAPTVDINGTVAFLVLHLQVLCRTLVARFLVVSDQFQSLLASPSMLGAALCMLAMC